MEGDMPRLRYWCHICSEVVNPVIVELAEFKCPVCDSGFVEEISSNESDELGSDHALSLWAPILLGIMGNRPRSRTRQDDDNETEADPSIIQRRRRSSATILQLLQGIRTGMLNRERLIFVNPFHQTIILHNQNQNQNHNGNAFRDYFIGPLLLRHLAENDHNRYGTPPTRKEVVDALPIVQIDQESSATLQCSVCLDDFHHGDEVKEMPCNHKFHNVCLSPWLQLHSSCPLCRYQLPVHEDRPENNTSLTLPWSFNTLFSPPTNGTDPFLSSAGPPGP